MGPGPDGIVVLVWSRRMMTGNTTHDETTRARGERETDGGKSRFYVRTFLCRNSTHSSRRVWVELLRKWMDKEVHVDLFKTGTGT